MLNVLFRKAALPTKVALILSDTCMANSQLEFLDHRQQLTITCIKETARLGFKAEKDY